MTNSRQTYNNTTTNPSESAISTTTTTSSSIHTEPGVSQIDPIDLETVREYYTELLGPLNAWKARDIERAFDAGLDVSAVLDALEQTAGARRPSHYYLVAVLNRYVSDGITSAAAAEAARERRRFQRDQANREKWSRWYASPEDSMPW